MTTSPTLPDMPTITFAEPWSAGLRRQPVSGRDEGVVSKWSHWTHRDLRAEGFPRQRPCVASRSAQLHTICPNETILRGLRRGEASAQRALCDRFWFPVDRTVGRLLGRDDERSDVVQQAFVNIISSIGSVEDPNRLEGWVYQVAVNTVRQEIRSRRYRRVVQYLAVPPAIGDMRSSPENALFSCRFYEVLESLQPEHRGVLVEFYLEGRCVAAIARRGECSVATAKRRLARARIALGKRVRRDPVLASALRDTDQDGSSPRY